MSEKTNSGVEREAVERLHGELSGVEGRLAGGEEVDAGTDAEELGEVATGLTVTPDGDVGGVGRRRAASRRVELRRGGKSREVRQPASMSDCMEEKS